MTMHEQLAADQERVNRWLAQYVETWPAYGRLQESMSYSLLSGGKRIRPVLVWEICRLFGGDPEKSLPFACGLEMLHTSSLIHDDLPCMDDDDLRRGRPTNHKVFGECTATLAGDALLIAAFEALSDADLSPKQCVRAVRCLAKAAGHAGMVGGQTLDTEGEGKALNYEEIVEIERLKTGCMIEAAARLGAIAADSTPEQEEAAARYARSIGLAFQIRDDLLDVLGDEAEFGKPIGSDAANEKATFVTLRGVEGCQSLIDQLTEEAVSCLRDYPGSEFLCELALYLAGRNK